MAQKQGGNKETQSKTFVGEIATTRGGLGFLTVPGFDEDVRIEGEHLNTALHRDTVEICLHPTRKGEQPRGEVLRVKERAKKQFVGIIEKEGGLAFLIPDNRKMYTDILISDPGNARDGDKALVEIVKWTDPKKDPLGKLIKVLGKKGSHEVEIQSIVLEHNIDTDFPAPVAKEARDIHKKWQESGKNYIDTATSSGERRDFRDIPTFTIDPHDAKDFDDALSFREIPNDKHQGANKSQSPGSKLYEIGIHIADVSHYVHPKTTLDQEAQERGFSVYLVDRTIPMLPEELSNDLCSLKPEVDRLAFSAVFTIDPKTAKVQKSWFGRGVIHSDKRFTYKEAQDTIDKGTGHFHAELTMLNTLAHTLRKKRFENGSIDFEQNEVAIELSEKGVPVAIRRKERLDTHKLVEEFMLLANRQVATYIWDIHKKKDTPKGFVYRAHDLPDKEKLDEVATLVRGLGYTFGKKGKRIRAQDINHLFEQIEGKPIEGLIKTAMLRTMAKATYTTKNIGHFGLGFEHYTHFTSPIRRYSDLVVHRLLQTHLDGKEISKGACEYFKKLTTELSEREIEVQRAERESIKLKQVEYMARRVGQTFNGIITGVTDWGVYVEETETGAEGLVHVRELTDDFYEYQQKKYRLVGQKTKKTYSLGDRVRFKVLATDAERKTIDLTFA